eukprot:c12130_g1_i2.p1 GENE.c12130_g1_i2~~c12130_g1_i2.p1  ORF type:complete len:426 (-),score=91.02 c12130_g1_i2:80-1273(-)
MAEDESKIPPADPILSPEAPVFVPKWKREKDTDANPQKDLGSAGFSNNFGRSNSGFPSVISPNRQPIRSVSGRNWKPPTSNLTRASSWRDTQPVADAWHGATSGVPHPPGFGAAATPAGTDDKTSKAITVEHRLLRPGMYSTWIRVLSADIGPAQLASVLSRCEESNSKGAIHVYLREKFIQRQLISQLKSQGYKFHHYVEETQTFVYGKRPQDVEDGKELINASAKEMVGCIVVSPDEQQVLLVWEGGKWMYVTGCAITRENAIDATRRELRSQLNIEVDRESEPILVGGWNKAAGKFDCINELFSCFVVKATTTQLNIEDDVHARWFHVAELLQLLDIVDQQFKEQGCEPQLDSAIEHPPGNLFSHLALRWIKVWKTLKGWPTSQVSERSVFCAM